MFTSKTLNKTIILFLISNIFIGHLFSEDLSLIHRVLDARLQTRLCSSSDEAISYMDSFRKTMENEGKLTAGNDEDNLIIDNMIALERYNYMYEKDLNGSDLKPFILSQYEKINAYKDSYQGSDFSPWFVLSSGDIINSSMQFLPQATAIKQGLREKDEYDKVIKDNPQLAFGFINAALWYYFAPAIGGGSKSLAKSYFEHALECSDCDYEAFYSRIYLSQVYFDEGNKDSAKKLIDECEKILPGTKYVSFIRYLNQNDFSLMYYTNNRDKVEKNLNKNRAG
ncbi:MAG: hypothetical protein K5786_11010 [Treponema sp.]|nr:hypothetical protein [Treponema sp.]